MYLKIRDRLGYMSNTSSNFEMTGTLQRQELRKRKTPQEKIAIIQQIMELGMTVSHVARLHGMQPSLLFKWKKQYLEGSLTAVAAGEDVVPASELAAAIKQIKELQRLLGKKTDPQRSGESMVSRENG
ncbi:transposase [Escherichia coli]|nr:transposase [Escherichia coli]KQC24071.1 transposase [Escherichia coli]KQJ37381.1 transposase [Escherichia coli]